MGSECCPQYTEQSSSGCDEQCDEQFDDIDEGWRGRKVGMMKTMVLMVTMTKTVKVMLMLHRKMRIIILAIVMDAGYA